jgi:hypothetical protein
VNAPPEIIAATLGEGSITHLTQGLAVAVLAALEHAGYTLVKLPQAEDQRTVHTVNGDVLHATFGAVNVTMLTGDDGWWYTNHQLTGHTLNEFNSSPGVGLDYVAALYWIAEQQVRVECPSPRESS